MLLLLVPYLIRTSDNVPPKEASTIGSVGERAMKEEKTRKIPTFEWSMIINFGGNRKAPEIVSSTKILHQGDSGSINIFSNPIFVWSM